MHQEQYRQPAQIGCEQDLSPPPTPTDVLGFEGMTATAPSPSAHPDQQAEALERLAKAMERLQQDEDKRRDAARRALVQIVSQAHDAIDAPLEEAAATAGVTVEQAQLALASLLAEGTITLDDDYHLSIRA